MFTILNLRTDTLLALWGHFLRALHRQECGSARTRQWKAGAGVPRLLPADAKTEPVGRMTGSGKKYC